VAGVSSVIVFSVVGLCTVVGIVECFVIVGIIAGGLSLASSAASAVICGDG